MDYCALHILYSLQFLSAPANIQIEYCGTWMPTNASDWFPKEDWGESAYNLYWIEKSGSPLSRLYFKYKRILGVFVFLEENTLPQEETILEEVEAVLNLMAFYQQNTKSYNMFWGGNVLRNSKEWCALRRLSTLALERLRWPLGTPVIPFQELLEEE